MWSCVFVGGFAVGVRAMLRSTFVLNQTRSPGLLGLLHMRTTGVTGSLVCFRNMHDSRDKANSQIAVNTRIPFIPALHSNPTKLKTCDSSK
jgi:hypothetical protein